MFRKNRKYFVHQPYTYDNLHNFYKHKNFVFLHEMIPMQFELIKERLRFKTVGIAGCGGLGSNCAVALARTGVGKLIIADFDVIDASNLNRQYYFADQIGMKKVDALTDNIHQINSEVHIVPIDEMLTAESIALNFSECDVIVEAFDKAEMKQMIIEAVEKYFPHIPLVSAMGIAGYGNINAMKVEQYGNIYLCGDFEAEVSDELPPLAPRVGVAANMQADVVITLLLEEKNV